MDAKEILNRAPLFGKNAWLFFIHPRKYVGEFRAKATGTSAIEVVIWSVSLSVLLVKLYAVSFQPLFNDVITSIDPQVLQQSAKLKRSATTEQSQPKIREVHLHPGLGFSFNPTKLDLGTR